MSGDDVLAIVWLVVVAIWFLAIVGLVVTLGAVAWCVVADLRSPGDGRLRKDPGE